MGWVVPRAGLDYDTLRLPGIEPRFFGGQASGQAANTKLRPVYTYKVQPKRFKTSCFKEYCALHLAADTVTT